MHRVKDRPVSHRISCTIYSLSLFILYLSSTLFHSFFALQTTRHIFATLDHCAIYILIAGSCTPFLMIPYTDEAWASYLLIFMWVCCFSGVGVSAMFPNWPLKRNFCLSMYLGMGWGALACIPYMQKTMPMEAINSIFLGGVGYTSGIPFFVRNKNMDHAIWHVFVLAGSIFHWIGIYSYIVVKF